VAAFCWQRLPLAALRTYPTGMAIYGTIFAATEKEFLAFAPSWGRPRKVPKMVAATNPFTGEPIQGRLWIPDGMTPDPGVDYTDELRRERDVIPPVRPPEGEFIDYQEYLEDRTPAGLRSVPHAAVKGIMTLEGLCAALGAAWIDGLGFISPNGDWVEELPPSAVERLASVVDTDLSAIAAIWASSDELHKGMEQDSAEWLLKRFCALCAIAGRTGRHVLFFVEALSDSASAEGTTAPLRPGRSAAVIGCAAGSDHSCRRRRGARPRTATGRRAQR
jgi:hypothetical protein